MASRPIKHSGASWRLILRRSVLRSAELLGAGLLGLAAVLLAIALLTYHQTDPGSTASGGAVLNWLGRPGAFVADGALLMFGPMAGLAVPLLLIFARQLWLVAEAEDAGGMRTYRCTNNTGCARRRCWCWAWRCWPARSRWALANIRAICPHRRAASWGCWAHR
jgi:hypothetical protein